MTREEMIKTLLTQLKSRMPVYLRIEKLNLLRDLSYKEKREDLLKQSCAAIIDLINENLKDFDEKQQRKCYEMLRDAYTQLGRYNFHAFLIAMEWNRQVEKRFYQPRMKVLRQVVADLQDLADGKINIYSLSMPPRVGKTTIGLFFITFMMGRYPDEHIFAVGYVSGLVGTFYQGVKDFIESNEYRFYDIFPELKGRLEVSAEDRTLHLGKHGERYTTATFRSVDGQITGALEASSLLYMDDMCSGIEEAMNIDRLNKLWDKVSVDVMQRRVHNRRTHKLAPILMIGTIWSVHDPISRTKNEHHNEPDYRERVMPALNEFQESNFDYDYSVGYTTEMYLELKRGMDEVSWECVYQQNPMERDGLLFPNGSLKRYLQLPKEPPDSIMAFCDVAFGGEDYLSFPIAYIWGEDGYIVDVVFRSRASYEATEPIVVAKIVQHGVQIAKFEANNGGDFYARDVSDMVDESNHRCNIVWERAGTKQSKLTRIIQFAPDIKSWYYKDPSMYTPKEDYGLFMTNLTTFVQTGSSPHDDAPDSMAGLSKMRKIPIYGQISSRAGIRSGF